MTRIWQPSEVWEYNSQKSSACAGKYFGEYNVFKGHEAINTASHKITLGRRQTIARYQKLTILKSQSSISVASWVGKPT